MMSNNHIARPLAAVICSVAALCSCVATGWDVRRPAGYPENREAAGFYRVSRLADGRWWMFNPSGRPYVPLGIDQVRYDGIAGHAAAVSGYHKSNLKKYKDRKDWETDALRRLESMGFNMLSQGCDHSLQRRGLAHTHYLAMGLRHCLKGCPPEGYIRSRPGGAFPNVFHPDFPAWCDKQAREECAPRKDDPWLVGYFIDNELEWNGFTEDRTGLFDIVMKLSDSHDAKKALLKYLSGKGVAPGGEIDASVKLGFLRLTAETYFKATTEAIRRHDPNHLVMGSRFAGLHGAHEVVWEVAGKYCDVVSFNCYPWADLDRNVVTTGEGRNATRLTDELARMHSACRKPMLVTEWSFPALDSELPCTTGAGQRLITQKQRARACELFAKTVLAQPFILGYTFFMWVDMPSEGTYAHAPENSNYGLVSDKGVFYTELVDMFTLLHPKAAHWRLSPVPAEYAKPRYEEGRYTSAEFMACHEAGFQNRSGVTFTRNADSFLLKNSRGFELSGRIGGKKAIESVRFNGKELGSFNGMLKTMRDGKPRYIEAVRTTDVDWREKDGKGVLSVSAEGYRGGMKFRLIMDFTMFPDSPRFLCDLVRVENIGTEKFDMDAFLFRQAPSFPVELRHGEGRRIPRLWKGPDRASWYRKDGTDVWEGISLSPLKTAFRYWLSKSGNPAPDIVFSPFELREVSPGGAYEPHGAMWMLTVYRQ